ncbi:hypothetical protein [Ruegeria sediminis]|nr:hypothetical protein [Ruegeria sediminis]
MGSIVHAALIEGTLETMSKVKLCAPVLAILVKPVTDRRAWKARRRGGV